MNQGSQYQAPPSPWNQQPSQGNQYPGNQGGNQYGQQQQYQQPPTPAPLMQVYEKKPEAKYVTGGSGGGMVSPPLAQIQVSCWPVISG